MGEAGDADDTAFPELNLDATEAAGIVGDVRAEHAEDALHHAGDRARFRRVRPARDVIGILPQVDFDPPTLGVDIDDRFKGKTVREARKGIVPAGADYHATRQLLDSVDHAPF